MNTIELQNTIIKKIQKVTDIELLKFLQKLLESDKEIYQLSEEESQFLNESMTEYENGKSITHEDVKSTIEK